MRYRLFHGHVFTATAALLAVLFWSVIGSSATTEGRNRGDYPRCQQECLARLEKDMARVTEVYSTTKNRLLYEQQVEGVNLEYNSCVRDCRELMPVK